MTTANVGELCKVEARYNRADPDNGTLVKVLGFDGAAHASVEVVTPSTGSGLRRGAKVRVQRDILTPVTAAATDGIAAGLYDGMLDEIEAAVRDRRAALGQGAEPGRRRR